MECPCPGFINPDDRITITDDGDLYFENKLFGKLILKENPVFSTTYLKYCLMALWKLYGQI